MEQKCLRDFSRALCLSLLLVNSQVPTGTRFNMPPVLQSIDSRIHTDAALVDQCTWVLAASELSRRLPPAITILSALCTKSSQPVQILYNDHATRDRAAS